MISKEKTSIAIQKKTAERIYGALTGGNGGKVRKIEEAAAWRKPEAALTDYDYFLRSRFFPKKCTLDDNLRARKILEDGTYALPRLGASQGPSRLHLSDRQCPYAWTVCELP